MSNVQFSSKGKLRRASLCDESKEEETGKIELTPRHKDKEDGRVLKINQGDLSNSGPPVMNRLKGGKEIGG